MELQTLFEMEDTAVSESEYLVVSSVPDIQTKLADSRPVRFALFRPFCIFRGCLDSNPESCRGKQVRYQLSFPSPFLFE
jgi:hypothetical protein